MTIKLPEALSISCDSEKCFSIHDMAAKPPRYFAALDDTHEDNPRTAEELEAHANLLAAAPQLLVALNSIAGRSKVVSDPRVAVSSEDWNRVIDEARAAIALARGGK